MVDDVGQGAGNRRIHYARGKTLGGSSARNYMIFHRSVSADFFAVICDYLCRIKS